MPVLRVDDEVWEWLKKNARPLEDTPNTVLRRIAGLDSESGAPANGSRKTSIMNSPSIHGRRSKLTSRRSGIRSPITNYGRELNEQWNVGARHALYHREGTYYNHLERFPGALFDEHGYLVIRTEKEYLTLPYLRRGKQLNIPGGISSVPGYKRVT